MIYNIHMALDTIDPCLHVNMFFYNILSVAWMNKEDAFCSVTFIKLQWFSLLSSFWQQL